MTAATAVLTPPPAPVRYRQGTHRAVAPEDTLARVTPLLPACGVTRVADITGLDRIGIPVTCAVRPLARLVQMTNGKGLTLLDARVSAVMEAVEHWHAEQPPPVVRTASQAEMAADGLAVLPPHAAPGYGMGVYLRPRFRLDWVPGRDLLTGAATWLPADLAHLRPRMLLPLTSNGLASGNTLAEATLHALYELVERDAVTRLSKAGLTRGGARVVRLDDGVPPALGALADRVRAAGILPVLMAVPTMAPLHTFWAVLLDPRSPSSATQVNMGHGTHLCPHVAATRALTEAAQSRLTFIHGSREDLPPHSYADDAPQRRLWDRFSALEADTPWSAFDDASGTDLDSDLTAVLEALRTAGAPAVWRIDLTRPEMGVPVVKMVVPGLLYAEGFLGRHEM